ncbi:MAG: glycosyltransferase family 39 protein [Chloroflexota bacterium]
MKTSPAFTPAPFFPVATARLGRRVALVTVVALAAWLRFSNLAALGYGNHYYTAAVVSMLQSWRNFFFAAAEPGGAVSVDKPPLGLWLQAISAHIFGVSGFSVMLPQLLAGILSVLVLYHLVRRSWGTDAGLLAALVLAITPVVVATDRNNTIDSVLIFLLLLAAWAFLKAAETGRLRYLLCGAVLVGLGFNVKMLQAFLPLPAFFALYFFGSPERLWPKVARLALALAVLLGVSLSWALIVDLTPTEQRPYVGSSPDNTEMSLILGYNGVQRLLGRSDGRDGGATGAGPLASPGGNGPGNPPARFQGSPPNDGRRVPPSDNRQAGPLPDGNPAGGGAFAGLGQAGALRLFLAPLGKEVGWLLPFALFSIVLVLLGARLSWPLAPAHHALVLWGGWLLTAAVFFSIASFFHEYYLSMLAAPLAALVAIGLTCLWRLHRSHRWLATAGLVGAAMVTLAVQFSLARAYNGPQLAVAFALACFLVGAVLVGVSALRRTRVFQAAGYAALGAALLVIPCAWSLLTMQNPTRNTSLPSAYAGEVSRAANDVQVNEALLAFLQANTQDVDYLMAVPSSMQGADYVIATGRPVLYLGGFNGSDPVVTADELAEMVTQGQLRYVYYSAERAGGMGMQSELAAWVAASCRVVDGFDTMTQNAGTPDGTSARGRGGSEISLYDCLE